MICRTARSGSHARFRRSNRQLWCRALQHRGQCGQSGHLDEVEANEMRKRKSVAKKVRSKTVARKARLKGLPRNRGPKLLERGHTIRRRVACGRAVGAQERLEARAAEHQAAGMTSHSSNPSSLQLAGLMIGTGRSARLSHPATSRNHLRNPLPIRRTGPPRLRVSRRELRR